MSTVADYPVIGPKAKFYGYVVGLNIEPLNEDEAFPFRRLATFAYGSRRTTWEVPDEFLFSALMPYLRDNAASSKDHGGMYGKVWIEKKGDGWSVDLP